MIANDLRYRKKQQLHVTFSQLPKGHPGLIVKRFGCDLLQSKTPNSKFVTFGKTADS